MIARMLSTFAGLPELTTRVGRSISDFTQLLAFLGGHGIGRRTPSRGAPLRGGTRRCSGHSPLGCAEGRAW